MHVIRVSTMQREKAMIQKLAAEMIQESVPSSCKHGKYIRVCPERTLSTKSWYQSTDSMFFVVTNNY